MQKIFLKFFLKYWPALLVLASILTFFHPVWREGKIPLPGDLIVGGYYPWLDYKWGYSTGVPVKNPITSDSISFSYPMRILAIEELKKGIWPLWNPYILAGTPLLANFQSAPFSVTNVFYFIFDKLTAWSLQIVTQHILAAFFLYLLLRYWNVGKYNAVFASILYAFCGFNLLWSQWNALTLAAAFLPLIVLLVDKWLSSGNLISGLLVSVSLSLQILSGYPQLVSYTLIAVLILGVIRFSFTKKYVFKVLLVIFFLTIGFGISSLQLLPAYELLVHSQRKIESIPLQWVFLDWRESILFLAPDYYGNHATGNYWGFKNYLSTIGYIGVVAAILSGFAIFKFKVFPEVRYAVVIVLISLLLSFPTPAGRFLWETNFMGFKAGVSYRVIVLFSFGIAILTAYGLETWFNIKNRLKFLPLLIPGIFLFGFATYPVLLALYDDLSFLGYIVPFSQKWKIDVALRNMVIPLFVFCLSSFVIIFSRGILRRLGGAIFFCLSLFEIFYFGWKFTPFTSRELIYPSTPVIDYLKSLKEPYRVNTYGVMPVNQGMPYNLEFLGGYDAIYSVLTAQYISTLNSDSIKSDPQDRFSIVDSMSSPLLNLANVKYFLVKDTWSGGLEKLYPSDTLQFLYQDKSVKVYENELAYPRAEVYFTWKEAQDKEVLNQLLKEGKDKKLVLEQTLPITKSARRPSEGKYVMVNEGEAEITVEVPQQGVLVVADSWFPGWKVYVNDNPGELLRANYMFRAVQVDSGQNKIKFIYEPEMFYLGLKLSLFSLSLVLFLGIIYIIVALRTRRYTS